MIKGRPISEADYILNALKNYEAYTINKNHPSIYMPCYSLTVDVSVGTGFSTYTVVGNTLLEVVQEAEKKRGELHEQKT